MNLPIELLDEPQQPNAHLVADASSEASKARRTRVLLAIVACGHQITENEVRLFRDPSAPGNTLSQICDRVMAAINERTEP